MIDKIKMLLKNKTFWEFIRYCFVGGISFLVDWGVMMLFADFILDPESKLTTGISTAAGFIVGLIINYVLSMLIVFVSKEQSKQGKTFYAFMVFTVIGIVGLGIKTALMYLGVDIIGINRYIFNIPAAGIVLIWNYIARKLIIFKNNKI